MARGRKQVVGLVALAVAVLAAGGVLLDGYLTRQHPATASRPATWAAPVAEGGLPNFHKVSDRLYRGAQPTTQGVRQLKALGIKTIVNLRYLHSDAAVIADTGIAEVDIPMLALHVNDQQAVRFLKVVTDPARGPVFVHCQHGSDRTGVTCAVYRIVVEGWGKEEAVREMTEGGLGFHEVWQNLVNYLCEMDPAALRAQAGLPEPATKPAVDANRSAQ